MSRISATAPAMAGSGARRRSERNTAGPGSRARSFASGMPSDGAVPRRSASSRSPPPIPALLLQARPMAPIALTDAQLDQVMTQAHQVPRALRDMYLQAVAERLRGKPFDDADVWRAAVAAMREILMKMRAAHQNSAGNQ